MSTDSTSADQASPTDNRPPTFAETCLSMQDTTLKVWGEELRQNRIDMWLLFSFGILVVLVALGAGLWLGLQ